MVFRVVLFLIICSTSSAAEKEYYPGFIENFGDLTKIMEPDGEVSNSKEEIRKLRDYVRVSRTLEVQKEAINTYQEAPGKDQNAMDIASKIGLIEVEQLAILDDLHNQAINYDLYLDNMELIKKVKQLAGKEEPAIHIYDNHSKLFCGHSSDLEKEVFPSCTAAQASSTAASILQFGDLKVSNLLDVDKMDEFSEFIGISIIQNLINPFPAFQTRNVLQDFLDEKEASPSLTMAASKKRTVAKDLAGEAVFATARNSLLNMYVDRKAIQVAGAAEPYSIKQLMKSEVGRRFQSKEWYQQVAISSEEALLREYLHMQAFKQWLQLKKYRQTERMELLLAVKLSLDQKLQATVNNLGQASGLNE